MDAEDLSFNHSSNTKVIKDLGTIFPRIGIAILSDGLIVKAVNSGDLSGLVVATKQGNVGRISELEAEQELKGLN